MDDYDYLFKCVVVGDGGSGKTAVVVRFSQGFFKENYKLTIGVEFAVKNLVLNNNTIKLQVWDTGGQPRFRYVRPLYYKGAMGCIVLFDLTNRESFDHVPKWLDEVSKEAGKIPMLLVGNKSDLVSQRVISTEDAQNLAKQLDMEYIESSAKTGDGIGDVFAVLSYLMMGEKIPAKYFEMTSSQAVSSPIQPKKLEPSKAIENSAKVAQKVMQSSLNRPKPMGLSNEGLLDQKSEAKINKPIPEIPKDKKRPPPKPLFGRETPQKTGSLFQSTPKPKAENPFIKIQKTSKPAAMPLNKSGISKEKRDKPLFSKEPKKPGFFDAVKESKPKNVATGQPQSRRLFSPEKKSSYNRYSSQNIAKTPEPEPKSNKCPNCGSEVNPNFKFCNKCGKRMR